MVLMYHDVYNKEISESGFQNVEALKYKISSSMFESHIELLNNLAKSGRIDSDNIEITFDDGGISAYSTIAPILEKYGFRGIFFITTSLIGQQGFLSVNQIKELDQRGHIIGSHSHTHPVNIAHLSNEVIIDEWITSKGILSKILNKEIDYASIPGGTYSKKMFELMNGLNYKYIFSSIPFQKIRKHKNAKIIGRLSIDNSHSSIELGKLFLNKNERVKHYLRWFVLDIAKRVLGKNYHVIRKRLLLRHVYPEYQ